MRLDDMRKSFPQLAYVLRPTQEWIRDQSTFSFDAMTTHLPMATTAAEALVDTLLVSVQHMLSLCPKTSDQVRCAVPGVDMPPDNHIRMGAQTTSRFASLLGLPELSKLIAATTTELSSLPHQLLQVALQRILPFLRHFLHFSSEVIESEARWTEELFKLDYVLCSLVHTLARRGFCIPPETQEDGGVGNEKGGQLDGTGIGEGAGMDNVSGEIQDESQVEGLQGDESDKMDGQDGTPDKNTIEMSGNFEGSLEDVASEAEDDGNETDRDDGDGPDEELGKLDQSDPDKVDEKLWGSETGEAEEGTQEEELHQDRSQHGHEESEIVAKKGKQAKEKKDRTQEDGKDDEKQVEDGNDEGEDGQEDDQPSPNAAGAPMDEHVPDADALDLPEDMNLDDDRREEDKSDLDFGEDVGENEGSVAASEQMDEDGHRNDTDGSGDDTSPIDDEPQCQDQQPRATEESEPDEPSTDSNERGEAVAKPDLTSGEGDPSTVEDATQPEDSGREGQKGCASTAIQNSSSSNECFTDVDMK